MPHMSYASWKAEADAYYASDQWKKLRQRALRRFRNSCAVCNRDGNETTLEAHHRTYQRFGQEDLQDLTVLCHSCHRTFHDSGRLSRKPPWVANPPTHDDLVIDSENSSTLSWEEAKRLNLEQPDPRAV